MIKTYKIEVDCAVCAGKMEKQAKKTQGILDASVSFIAQKIKIEFEEGIDREEILKNLNKACKKIEPDCEIFY